MTSTGLSAGPPRLQPSEREARLQHQAQRRRLRRRMLPFVFILPWILGVFLFQAYPILDAFYHSFTIYDVFQPAKWVGLRNYRNLFENTYTRMALLNTLLYVAVSVPGGLIVGLLQALLLNVKVRGLQLFRTLAIVPGTVPAAGAAAVSVFIWSPGLGLINSILEWLGLPWRQSWIIDPVMVKWIFIFMTIQGGIGMLIFLAGLQNVPQELYDASKMDGARSVQTLFSVTLPMLTPYTLFNLLTSLIGAFQYFTAPMLMTGGGPAGGSTFYAQIIYENAFVFFRMGHAAALAWILFVICVVIVFAVFRSSASWVYYEGGN
ncbi:MAG: sugar ABC transporter permease [Caldilineaceae bacterium SB0662_bin_9]|uniref:Sugar ABC transporter permease n=1 Tax=Caldilineaceae bacterium SB0662_bin_9 TaxID=2605258 RepID=A0A6B1DSF0_9CHLR|nr:sugar ABC transporter permease [Caldilineaceae bacterium SB0666_bin_21]MYD89612.1 sugar ABC transporter permease [Caldilineaceae bacterium SB0662_bin_9]